MDEAAGRDQIDKVARSWIGTPFHDNASLKGIGVDCAQLLRKVFIEAGVLASFDVAPYPAQWFLHRSEERFLAWVTRFAREVTVGETKPGDVALYKIGRCFAHGAIIVSPGWPTIIHAHCAGRIVRRADGLQPGLGIEVRDLKFFSAW